MKSELVMITGGVRSGKSALAQSLAEEANASVLFVATAQALDEEMAKRIRQHQRSRPESWATLEEPLNVAEVLRRYPAGYGLVVVDCLTLWATNLLLKNESADDKSVLGPVEELLRWQKKIGVNMIVVTNEVGMGVIPANAISRRFSDLLGKANQLLADAADKVYLMVSGLPVQLKPTRIKKQVLRH